MQNVITPGLQDLILLHLVLMQLSHFVLVLHFAAILITFCISITFCSVTVEICQKIIIIFKITFYSVLVTIAVFFFFFLFRSGSLVTSTRAFFLSFLPLVFPDWQETQYELCCRYIQTFLCLGYCFSCQCFVGYRSTLEWDLGRTFPLEHIPYLSGEGTWLLP